ncbi:hypothetical protein EMPS_00346 [Entomortierella parvispora]|uniref:Swiss Army Knife RNA repair protein HAD domain-containing protein n=1 Tax=Entomortierella parvispora TaxID=205924 RepID=A0A9P3H0U1_9FUNG|nr:hypothetical protein EMPS_00346 [Entomortierella parvispora]
MEFMDTDMTEASASLSFTTTAPTIPATASNTTTSALPTEPISELLTHPALAYANLARLQDPAQTALLHTVHVYDFDQTLFRSPLPNPALWDHAFVGLLQAWNGVGGGWWHNPATLDGLGPEAEATAWDGWWNEELVDNIRQSAADPVCLTVLLTGRFGPIHNTQILKMIRAKGLVFDLVASKPSTVALLENYHQHHNHHHLKQNRHQQQYHPRLHHRGDDGSSPSLSGSRQRREEAQNSRREGIRNHREETNTTNASASATAGARIYRKIHTYNTKLDFLYHILFEYPQLQHMHLWDDRPEQMARFHRIGQSWLASQRLQTFQITHVFLSPKYLDMDLEQDLVENMVKEHNTLVRMEQRGAPSWVAGLGPLPKTRPELEKIFSERGSRRNPEGYDFWGPMETYSPPARVKIEMVELVQTTGISFASGVQRFLKSLVPMDVSTPRLPEVGGSRVERDGPKVDLKANRPSNLRGKDMSFWAIPEDLHVPLSLGVAPTDFATTLGGLGSMVLVEIVASGEYGSRVWALQVKDASPISHSVDSPLSPQPSGSVRHAGRYFAAGEASAAQQQATLRIDADSGEEEPVILVGPTGAVFSSIQSFMAGAPPIQGRVVLRKDHRGSPNLTLAHMVRGNKPSMASKINHWEPFELYSSQGSASSSSPQPLSPQPRIIVVGTIAEKHLWGTKPLQNYGHLATIARPEVQISQIIKDFMAQQQQPLSGPELGAVIQTVQQVMERLNIPNKSDRAEQITALTRTIVYRDLIVPKNEAAMSSN